MGLFFAITYRYFSSPSISGGNGISGAARRRVSKILQPTMTRGTMRGSCVTSTAFSTGDKSGHLSIGAKRHESQRHVANNMESSTECSFSEAQTPGLTIFRRMSPNSSLKGTSPTKKMISKRHGTGPDAKTCRTTEQLGLTSVER